MGTAEAGSLLDLDWRFLLPLSSRGRFRHLLLLGAPVGAAEQLEALGVAEEVAVKPGERQPDAVVCLRCARHGIREVAAAMPRGAAVYYEIDGPNAARFTTSRRSLRRLGFSSSALYLVHPNFEGARSYVPLDVEHALGWYLSSLGTASTVTSAALGHGARLVGRLSPAIPATLSPRLALVAVAGQDRDACPAAIELAELPRNYGEPHLRPLMLVHGDERSRVVMLPFGSASHQPLAVMKIDRRPPAEGRREAEYAALENLRLRLSPELRETVPQPLAIVRDGPLAATVESFLRGEWLHARWARRSLALPELMDDLDAVAAWLSEFHAQSRLEVRAWGENEVEHWVEQPIAEYEQAFGATAAESRLFANARVHARDATGLRLPVVWQHWDLSSLNILRHDGVVNVVDWEAASPGVPLDDLLYFVTRWLDRARAGRDRRNSDTGYGAACTALRQLFLEPRYHDPVVDAARNTIDRYMCRIELDRRFLPLLLLHAWVRRATGRLARHEAVPGSTERPRQRNRYVAYIGVLAEHTDRLFRP